MSWSILWIALDNNNDILVRPWSQFLYFILNHMRLSWPNWLNCYYFSFEMLTLGMPFSSLDRPIIVGYPVYHDHIFATSKSNIDLFTYTHNSNSDLCFSPVCLPQQYLVMYSIGLISKEYYSSTYWDPLAVDRPAGSNLLYMLPALLVACSSVGIVLEWNNQAGRVWTRERLYVNKSKEPKEHQPKWNQKGNP